MPRACPVESSRYPLPAGLKDPHGCHGLVPWRIHVHSYIAPNVSTPRGKPVASGLGFIYLQVAVIVKYHGGKPVASLQAAPAIQTNHPRLKIPVATWRASAMIVQDGFTPGAVGNKLESAT